MSHKVTIKVRPNPGPQPDDLYYDGNKKISSTWLKDKRDLRKGISLEEERRLLPSLLGVSDNDPMFAEKARKFWANLELAVPAGGVELETGLDDKDFPLNPRDYILYHFAKSHHQVAESEAALRRDQLCKWFVYDPQEAERARHDELKKHKEAYKEYLEISEDPAKMDWMLLFLGVTDDPVYYFDLSSMNKEQKDFALENYTKTRPLDFVRFAKDKKLQLKAGIEQAVSASIFEKTGGAYYYGDVKLGGNLEEAVRFLEDKANSKIMLIMKENLEVMSDQLLSATTQKEIRSGKTKVVEPEPELVDDTAGDDTGSPAGASKG